MVVFGLLKWDFVRGNNMTALIIMATPLMALGMGWLYGKNYEPPLVDPEEYVMWGVE
jgi:hypothetical protein